MKAFGIIWTGFAVFWTVTALSSGWIMGLVGIFFVLVGVKQFFIGSGKCYYAITNMRVLTLTKNRLSSSHLSKIGNISIIGGKNGIGSVIFQNNEIRYVHYNNENPSYRFTGGGLYGICDTEEAYRILNEAVYAAQNPKK